MRISEIIKSKCCIWQKEAELARVYDVIVDIQKPRIIALLARKKNAGNWLLIKMVDVVESWGKVVWLRDPEVLLPIENMPNIKMIVENNLLVLGRKAINTNGKVLGRITDLNFDLISGMIMNFEIERGFGFWKKNLLINSKYFLEVTNRGVIFEIDNDGLKMQEIRQVELAIR